MKLRSIILFCSILVTFLQGYSSRAHEPPARTFIAMGGDYSENMRGFFDAILPLASGKEIRKSLKSQPTAILILRNEQDTAMQTIAYTPLEIALSHVNQNGMVIAGDNTGAVMQSTLKIAGYNANYNTVSISSPSISAATATPFKFTQTPVQYPIPSPTPSPKPGKQSGLFKGMPSKTPHTAPASTNIPPADPNLARLIIGAGIMIVVVVILGVWINRYRLR